MENKNYFGEKEEVAIRLFLLSENQREKNTLFKDLIDPAFKSLVDGVLQMPMFQKIIGVSREDLFEDTYHHIISGMEKFNPSTLGKDGKPVKAFSYFGTAAKNYILYAKIQNDKKIARHGGVLDVDDFSNVIEDKGGSILIFNEKREDVITKLKMFSLIKNTTKNDLLVCNCLIYMLNNWDKLEFGSKNEFNRLLLNYTGLKNNTVIASLKKIKIYLKEKEENSK